MALLLNARAWDLVDEVIDRAQDLRVQAHEMECGTKVVDFGVRVPGSLTAGLRLADVCMSGLAQVSLCTRNLGDIGWPHVLVATDHPVEACLFSQYAGWEIRVGDYFAMGSGPMRAAAAREDLFNHLDYREDFYCSVGVLETAELPTSEVVREIAEKARVEPRNLMLLVAPTSSLAGNLQVVARSVETSLHKLLELGFDVRRIVSAVGTAPLAPVAKDDLQGIGRSNDAILYGGQVTLYITGPDEGLREIGTQVPSSASPAHGKPFLQVFEEAKYNFFEIDPLLFSPAEVVMQNVETGSVFRFGRVSHNVLIDSFNVDLR